MTAYLDHFLHLAIELAVFAVVFVSLEHFFALRREKVLRPQFANDLAYYFINGLFLSALMALPIAGLVLLARHLVPEALIQSVAALPLWARVPLALVIGDIGAYWGHRWSHKLKSRGAFTKCITAPCISTGWSTPARIRLIWSSRACAA